MGANVEIKARLTDRAGVERRARALAGGGAPTILRQVDTFFPAPRGRLKLRERDAAEGELIAYERPDAPGPKRSEYRIARTPAAAELRETLAAALGVVGVVRKTRTLYLVGQTRVHLDEVEELGGFLELEVVLAPGQSAADGERVARDLMERLGVRPDDLVAGAYLDLLRA
jgi:predicted adenylyl cyclase CyaB